MMAVRLIVDSASDYTKREAEREGMVFLPMSVSFDGVAYRDGENLDKDTFFHLLVDEGKYPTTSQPTPQSMMDAFQTVVDDGDEGVFFVMGSSLSGTYQTAQLIAERFGGKIEVVDTWQVTIGERLLIRFAQQCVAQGMATAKEVADAVRAQREREYVFGYLDTLEYLKRGGRISPAINLIAGLLAVKPVVMLRDNQLNLAAKGRGRGNALKLLTKEMEKIPHRDNETMIAAYSGKTRVVLDAYLDETPQMRVPPERIFQLGSTVGTHAGPGVIGFAFFGDPV